MVLVFLLSLNVVVLLVGERILHLFCGGCSISMWERVVVVDAVAAAVAVAVAILAVVLVVVALEVVLLQNE